jgi:hypothetical protein
MGKKIKPRAAPAPPGGAPTAESKKSKATKAAAAAAADDIAQMFASVGTAKLGKLPPAAAPKPAAIGPSPAPAEAEPSAPKHDGIFRARPQAEVAMTMGDEAFFGGTPVADGADSDAVVDTADGKSKKKKKKIISLGVEPGMRVVTEDDIVSMTKSKNANAGMTENCPFDCDCCF